MANKAAAEVLEASSNAERAQLLCSLEQQKNEFHVSTRRLRRGAQVFRQALPQLSSAPRNHSVSVPSFSGGERNR